MYLVDSFALFEWLIHGNQKYAKIFEQIQSAGAFTTHLSLLEFYHWSFHNFGKEEADGRLSEVISYLEIVPLDIDLIKVAGIFRSNGLRQKKKFSYTDSVNYAAAQRLKIKLLTGDQEFKGMKNVEFVPKASA